MGLAGACVTMLENCYDVSLCAGWRMGHCGGEQMTLAHGSCWRMCHYAHTNMSLLCSGWRMGHESTERGFICYSVGGWLCRVGLAQFRIVRFPFAFDVKSHQTFRSWTVACIFKTSVTVPLQPITCVSSQPIRTAANWELIPWELLITPRSAGVKIAQEAHHRIVMTSGSVGTRRGFDRTLTLGLR